MLTEEQKQTAEPSTKSTSSTSGLMRALLVIAAALLLVLAWFVYRGVTARNQANAELSHDTLANTVPTVAVVKPKVVGSASEIVLPGNMQAFTDTPIWARSSGYLKAWHVDIGARVHRGQLLAEIESPELDQQLQQAKATLSVASANLRLSEITANRYNDLFKTDSVARQDVDNAVQDASAKRATVNADQAAVARLQQLVAYERVFAPFDGVITARNVDVGALVDADSNTVGKELFHLSSNATLRVFISVPEMYSRAAGAGVPASLTLTEFPGRQFHGTIVRNAGSIDLSSRTLLVEVDVPNRTGELLPGSYASVHLKIPSKIRTLSLPSNTLLFRSEGLQVGLVQDGKVRLVPVTIGHDHGDSVEIVSALSETDQVIVNPSDSLASGQKVQVSQS